MLKIVKQLRIFLGKSTITLNGIALYGFDASYQNMNYS